MKTEYVEKAVAQHKFLEGLEPRWLEKIAACSTVAQFAPGKPIFKQGDPAENFYLITRGRVAVGLESAGKGTLLVETLNVGEVLGWSWLVPPHQWRFNAVAASVTHAVVVNGKELTRLCEEDHGLGYEIMKRFLGVIAARLEMANVQILETIAKK